MTSFTQTYIIQAPVSQVWKALTHPDLIDEWGGGPATMEETAGFNFELWGGDIWGKNIEVVRNKRLKQEWFAGEWPESSIVTFELAPNGGQTTVTLTHENIPDTEVKSLYEGWQAFYLGPLKNLLEKSNTQTS